MKKHNHPDKSKGMIHALYIFQGRKWAKIGEVCTGCGAFFIDPQLLKSVGIITNTPTVSFNGLSQKQ